MQFDVRWPEATFSTLDGPQAASEEPILSALGGNYSYTGSGGVLGGGAAQFGAVYNPTASGGALGGGTAGVFVIYSPQGSGGALGGGSTQTNTYSETGTGGAIAGGSASSLQHGLIWVADANLVGLPFEIVHYDPMSGVMYLVFKANVLTASTNTYYIYYGYGR